MGDPDEFDSYTLNALRSEIFSSPDRWWFQRRRRSRMIAEYHDRLALIMDAPLADGPDGCVMGDKPSVHDLARRTRQELEHLTDALNQPTHLFELCERGVDPSVWELIVEIVNLTTDTEIGVSGIIELIAEAEGTQAIPFHKADRMAILLGGDSAGVIGGTEVTEPEGSDV